MNEIIRKTKIIRDKKNRKYEAVYDDYDDSDSYPFVVNLYHSEVLIGTTKCMVEADEKNMLLGDLIIYERHQINRDILYRVEAFFFNYPKSYRRLGLGTELLKMVIDKAKESGMKFLYGRVTQEDFNNNPNLLKWYEKHGFCIEPPLPPPNKDSIARICLYLE